MLLSLWRFNWSVFLTTFIMPRRQAIITAILTKLKIQWRKEFHHDHTFNTSSIKSGKKVMESDCQEDLWPHTWYRDLWFCTINFPVIKQHLKKMRKNGGCCWNSTQISANKRVNYSPSVLKSQWWGCSHYGGWHFTLIWFVLGKPAAEFFYIKMDTQKCECFSPYSIIKLCSMYAASSCITSLLFKSSHKVLS